MTELRFTVYGMPAPGGSKRAFKHPHTGKIIVADANKKAKPWQYEVKAAAVDALGGSIERLLTGPIELELNFYAPRPAGHYGTGRNEGIVKSSAPAYPTGRPDVLKLARAVEDALTSIVWKDDAQIVLELLAKHYGEPARCEVVIRTIDRELVSPPDQVELPLSA